jgi:3-oxo-4-pregnene-20-carboxyl-CoA dehydrogenase alpha subunit
MIIDLSDEALEFGVTVRKALESAGGDQLVQMAESEPDRRESIVAPVLGELGAWSLDPRAGSDELEAAAALCRSVGYWSVAYPVAERLCRPADLDVDGLVVVADVAPAAAIAGIDLRWAAVDMTGRRHTVASVGPAPPPRQSAFVVGLDLEPVDDHGADDLPLALVLPCWTLLGLLDRAMDLAHDYVLQREQFGQPLAAFQGVQFQLTDAEVERVGVEELAKYALWTIEAGQPGSLDSALALRLAALEAADTVFRIAHQLHGAIGFCDETVLSWVSRYSLPLRRLPFGLSATLDQLSRHLGRQGLDGLFTGAYPE